MIDRPAFEANLEELFAALDKPLSEATRDGWWKALAKMSNVEFARCCERLLQQATEGEAVRLSVPAIWEAKRGLRAQAPAMAAPAAPEREHWEQAGINRAGAHLCRERELYTHPDDKPTPEQLRREDWRPHPVSLQLRAPLWEAGRAWATEMRLSAEKVTRMGLPELTQKDGDETWAPISRMADAQAHELRERLGLPPALASITRSPTVRAGMEATLTRIESGGTDQAEAA